MNSMPYVIKLGELLYQCLPILQKVMDALQIRKSLDS